MNEDTKIDPAAVQVSVLSRGIVGAQLAIDAVMPLGDVALRVRQSGKLASSTSTVRRVLAQGGRDGGYERRKLLLPAAVPAARAPAGTPLKQLSVSHHNGLYGFDLDEDRDNLDVAGVRTALEAHPAVVLVGISAGGDAHEEIGERVRGEGQHARDEPLPRDAWRIEGQPAHRCPPKVTRVWAGVEESADDEEDDGAPPKAGAAGGDSATGPTSTEPTQAPLPAAISTRLDALKAGVMYEPQHFAMAGALRGIAAALAANPALMPPQVVAFYGGADGVIEAATATAVNTWALPTSAPPNGEVEKRVAALDWADCLGKIRMEYAEASAAGHRNIGQIVGDWMGRELQTELPLGG